MKWEGKKRYTIRRREGGEERSWGRRGAKRWRGERGEERHENRERKFTFCFYAQS